MEFRKTTKIESEYTYLLGYPEWGYDISWEEYLRDCYHEDTIGTRYVLIDNNVIIGTLILFKYTLNIDGNLLDLYGIGSVVVPTIYRGKSFGRRLIKECINKFSKDNSIFLLYSSINPQFYKKIGFVEIPNNIKVEEDSNCLIYCNKKTYTLLSKHTDYDIPKCDFGCYS